MLYGRSPHGEQQAVTEGLRAKQGSDYCDRMKHLTISRVFVLLVAMAGLSSCAVLDRMRGRETDANQTPVVVEPVPEGPLSAASPMGGGKSAAALDQTSAAQKAAATAAPTAGAERDLGTVIVALGSPAEQGFWLRSALVTAPATGRVVTTAGKTVNVDLQPGTGGALLSLAAYRALGLRLTDLPEVTVFAN